MVRAWLRLRRWPTSVSRIRRRGTPPTWYSDNKSCPCGVGPNDEYCSDPNRSDPNRSGNVTVYAAGGTVAIQAHEVVGHTGRWRVAFDPDGADLADFNANILLDVADPSGGEGNVGQGDLWEFVVTLPNVPCTTCTLQLLQVMNGNPVDPVPDPTGHSTYYQCADIELTGGPVDTATSSVDTATCPGTTDADTGTPPAVETGVPVDTASSETGDTGAGASSGCGCDGGGAGSFAAGWLLFGAPWVRRRR